MPVLLDHAKVSNGTLEAVARIENAKKKGYIEAGVRRTIEMEKDMFDDNDEEAPKALEASTGVDRLFDEVDDVGVPTGLALVLAQVREGDRRSTAYDLKHALFLAGKHDLCAMVKLWLVRDEARSDEEEKERYREIAAKRLASERLAAHMNVERLAAHLQREDDRDFAKYSRAQDVVRLLAYWRAKDMKAGPPEPPVALERKALNQLDKRAKTRKLAGPKEAKDDEEHRENKQQRELRNAQTKARNQKRAKARAHKLAA